MQHYTVYLFVENCSTCFGWYFYPSSGAYTTVFTVSGTCQTVIATCCYCGMVGTGFECGVVNVLICFGVVADATAPKQINTFSHTTLQPVPTLQQ